MLKMEKAKTFDDIIVVNNNTTFPPKIKLSKNREGTKSARDRYWHQDVLPSFEWSYCPPNHTDWVAVRALKCGSWLSPITHGGERPDKCNQCDSTSSNTGTLRKHMRTAEHLEQRERDGSWVSPINQRPPWQPAARQQLPIQTCNSTKKHTVCYNTENILNIYTPAK